MFVPKSALAIVSHCDMDCSRYALGAVQFERDENGGALAIATDGRRMAVLSWRDPDMIVPGDTKKKRAPFDQTKLVESIGLDTAPVDKFASLLPAKALASASKMLTAKKALQDTRPVLNSLLLEESSANGTVKIGAHNGESASTTTIASQDGRFPKWRDVLPDSAETVSVKLDPQYLAEACELLQGFASSEDCRGVTLTLHKSTEPGGVVRWDVKPVVLSADHGTGRSGKVVIMPLASDR